MEKYIHCNLMKGYSTDNATSDNIPITILFMPNKTIYDLGCFNFNYYTALIGLGNKPEDVKLKGNFCPDGYTTSISNIFFRTISNLTINNDLIFGSSQMCPIRNCIINGNLNMDLLCTSIIPSWGFTASGGYVADTTVTKKINLSGGPGGKAQQLLLNRVDFATTENLQMNYVMLDCKNSGKELTPNQCTTSIAQKVILKSPVNKIDFTTFIAPKITYDTKYVLNGEECVICNNLDKLQHLIDSKNKNIVLIAQYYGNVSKNTIINIKQNNVTIHGLGWPVLIGVTFIISGTHCTLSSLIFDACKKSINQQNCILSNSGADNLELYDICTRTTLGPSSNSLYSESIGVEKMIEINSADSYLENVWAWRGDHWNTYLADSVKNCNKCSGPPPQPKPLPKPYNTEKLINNCLCKSGQPPNETAFNTQYSISSSVKNSGDWQGCGAKCDNNSDCIGFVNKGTWCGLYNRDKNQRVTKDNDTWSCKRNTDTSPSLGYAGISVNVNNKCQYTSSGGSISSCKPFIPSNTSKADASNWMMNSCYSTATGFNIDPNKSITGENGENNYNPIGIYIIGKNCKSVGLFVEHQTCYPILWEGNNGTIIFSQGECAYYNSDYNCSKINNYDTGIYMTLGSNVTNFYYNGGGIYAIFNPTKIKAVLNIINIKYIKTGEININNLVSGYWASSTGFQNFLLNYSSISAPPAEKKRYCNLLQQI